PPGTSPSTGRRTPPTPPPRSSARARSSWPSASANQGDPVTDTLWSDISEFQVPVTNAYPCHFLCLRSNDGTYQDHHFTQNIAWPRGAVHAGRLWGFMVYYFYRPGVNGARVLMSRVGHPDPDMAVMIDVESAGGQVAGNQSAAINAQHDELVKWLGN